MIWARFTNINTVLQKRGTVFSQSFRFIHIHKVSPEKPISGRKPYRVRLVSPNGSKNRPWMVRRINRVGFSRPHLHGYQLKLVLAPVLPTEKEPPCLMFGRKLSRPLLAANPALHRKITAMLIMAMPRPGFI